jgi:hypothetical protein
VTPTATPDVDALAVVERLDSAALRTALNQLDERRRALTVLLRAAAARERAARRRQAGATSAAQGGQHVG